MRRKWGSKEEAWRRETTADLKTCFRNRRFELKMGKWPDGPTIYLCKSIGESVEDGRKQTVRDA